MFYIFLLFHIIVFLESYLLAKKKLRQKSTILILANTLFMIINLIVIGGSLKVDYSSVLYMQDLAINHSILIFIWILVNIAFFALIFVLIHIAEIRKKQTKALKNALYIFIGFLFFIFVLMLFQSATVLLVLIGGIASMYYLGKNFVKKKKNSYLVMAILILIALTYSYGTYTGAARFQIALAGYPLKAYNTGLEELRYYKEENVKKYMPTTTISTASGDMGMIEVKSYGVIKIGTYIGF